MKRKDLLWLIASPVYAIITTTRHEGSHALAAMAEGAKITEFVFWPSHLFQFGYVVWEGPTTWFTTAAPYFCDLFIFFIAILVILKAKPQRRWLWFNILAIGVASPLVNSALNYFGGFMGQNDIDELLQTLDPVAVHLYFALTLLLYAWGLYYCYFRKETWHPK